MRPVFLPLSAAALVALLPPPLQAQNRVEGVNPADLLTQVQVTGEFNQIDDDTSQWTVAGKYDYRIAGTSIGLNFELPVAISLDGPGFRRSGHGDFFSRARYVRSFGRWSVGGAFELVAPIGSDTFSTGRWQTNPAVLGVYAWDQSNLSALVHKRVLGYIEDDESKPDINQYQWRALQIHIFPSGYFVQGDVAHWSDVRDGRDWFETRASIGKQISARSRLQAELKKQSGDVRNDWALSVSYATRL
jgi:hypothetical protein